MQKILITGGAGFIGSHATASLLKKGYHIVCIDNFDPFYDEQVKKINIKNFLGNPNYKFYKDDIRKIDRLNQIFQKGKIDKIIHLAAKAGVRPSLENPKAYEETNIGGTLNLLELARKYSIKQFIFGSSSSVYGNNKQVPFSEEDKTDFQISPYGTTKRAGELLCRTYSHLYRIPITCLRFFTVYGPKGRPDMAPYKFTEAIYKGLPITKYGDGTSRRDYTYIDDIIDGIASALAKPFQFEIINLGGGDKITLNKFISLIERLVGKKGKIKISSKQKGDVDITYADISKAKRLLNYQPKYKVADGMKKFVAWYLKNQRNSK